MTWYETHERTRIIREVEAAATIDAAGRLPWKDSWAEFFGSPEGLVQFLRARWERMGIAQLDELDTPEKVQEALGRMRRSNAGVLRILAAHGQVGGHDRPQSVA